MFVSTSIDLPPRPIKEGLDLDIGATAPSGSFDGSTEEPYKRWPTGCELEFKLGRRGIGKSGSESSFVVGRFVPSFWARDTSDGREGRVKRRWRRMLPLGVGGPVMLSRLRAREVNVGMRVRNGLGCVGAAVAVAVAVSG